MINSLPSGFKMRGQAIEHQNAVLPSVTVHSPDGCGSEWSKILSSNGILLCAKTVGTSKALLLCTVNETYCIDVCNIRNCVVKGRQP